MKIVGRLILILGAIGLSVLAVHFALFGSKAKSTAIATPSATVAAKPTASPTFDPIQIAAIKARTYTASELKVTQNLAAQSGYSQSVDSFTSDGFTEYALVSTPTSTAPAGGWPAVILVHGYIDPSTYQTTGPEYADIIASLARAGYVVIKPDLRGHGKSQGQPDGGHFSPDYAYDVLNLLATTKQYAGVNPARIGLVAHSMGGHAALRAIVTGADVKATVLMSGVVGSFNDLLYHWPNSPMPNDQPAALVQGAKNALLAKYGTPQTNPTFWDSASAINYVSGIGGAVQINHSVGDTTVPVAFARELNMALTTQYKTVDYHEYPGDDHQLSANRAAFTQNMLSFLHAHL